MAVMFQTFIDRLHRAEQSDGLRDAMAGFGRVFGFSSFGYIGFPRPAPQLPPYLTNYPAAWVQHYLKENYLEIDPVVALAKHRATPFLWDCRDPRLQDSSAQSRFMVEAIAVGIERGLAIPIRDTRCGHAILVLASDRTLEQVHATVARYGDVIGLAALHFHVHAQEKL